jgi:hypothetical protein
MNHDTYYCATTLILALAPSQNLTESFDDQEVLNIAHFYFENYLTSTDYLPSPQQSS